MKVNSLYALVFVLAAACQNNPKTAKEAEKASTDLQPLVVTDTLPHDSDDPAIWINPNNLMESLVIGTDKDSLGGLYAFNLDGKIVGKSITLGRPNNVDIGYGLPMPGGKIDFAVTGERHTEKLRIFSLPDLQPIDKGGIDLFVGETAFEHRAVMGVAVHTDSAGNHYAIVSRKTGPTDGTYLWQYRLLPQADGTVGAELVRKFGQFSGNKEIEALAVDHELGYVYCSDEQVGIRKYYVDPRRETTELALFGTEGFADDHEGITICSTGVGKGYLIVSDQGRHAFRFFSREGSNGNPHNHRFLGSVQVAARSSDGSELTRESFNGRFPGGLFVAMSDDRTFHYYSLDSLVQRALAK